MGKIEEVFDTILKNAERDLIFLIIVLLGCFSVYQVAINTGCCHDVLRYTIPAVSFDEATILSESAYWQSTSLIEHFRTMPTSAQRYFIHHSVGCGLYCALSLITMAVNGHILRKRARTITK